MSGIPLIPKGWTQPIFVEVCIPHDTQPGNYTGTLRLVGVRAIAAAPSQPASWSGPGAGAGAGGRGVSGREMFASFGVKLEVWDIALPLLNDSGAFNTAFNFDSNMSAWYPHGTQPEVNHY